MRFLFIDRITKMEKGKTAEGIKTFSLADECHRNHFSKSALVPGVLLIETMAQVLGWLINYSHDFKFLAIMSLLEGVRVPATLRPGIAVRVRGEILSTASSDSLGRAWAESLTGESIAQIDRILYTHRRNLEPAELLRWYRYVGGIEGFVAESDGKT